MARGFRRPRTKEEEDNREVMGLWRAQALAKDIGESSEKITMDTIRRIHQVFFGDTFPEIGRASCRERV